MQQVGRGTRFWWRALDAQSPDPVTPTRPPLRYAEHGEPTARPPVSAPIPTPAPMPTLEIPRADRRRRRKVKTRRTRKLLLLSTLLAGITTASAAVAVFAPENAWSDFRDELDARTTAALIATGFGIDQVSLIGQRYTLDTDVFDALDLANVKTFAALDTEAVLRRIERISWVDTAQITRIYPGKLRIDIKERLPAAIWTRGDMTYLIDITGRTLGPLPKNGGWVLPRVSGEGANVDTPLLFTALERHQEIENHFNYAERISERRWRIVLDNATRIELAADREVEGLDTVAESRFLRRALNGLPMVVDVRTPGRATVRPLTTDTAFNDSDRNVSATVTP